MIQSLYGEQGLIGGNHQQVLTNQIVGNAPGNVQVGSGVGRYQQGSGVGKGPQVGSNVARGLQVGGNNGNNVQGYSGLSFQKDPRSGAVESGLSDHN